ncbi:hypothetical protein HOP50_04g30970 [Chloropicon primus]|uniref:Small ribosomal subunit protein mS33 n=1 Tax=Chloropicon primus TaxID=1764295 RepID=A0A5B8MJH2_9CHLO|nr:hypothetical protein A3770_04p30950 [Chloropicon primus]UPQ99788.1 hypothetical protein HOP50_04g30970 [Chloropicon primus]|eukprot:QDZ20577.1 hypothetical protein A3770_04p30950 [Chloropicon primus]
MMSAAALWRVSVGRFSGLVTGSSPSWCGSAPSLARKFAASASTSTEEGTKVAEGSVEARNSEEGEGLGTVEEVKVSAGAKSHVVTKEYLDQVRWKIFGTYVGNGLRSGRKVLRKNLIGDKVVAWYPQMESYGKPHQGDKLWDDPDLFIAKDRLERYQRRGKGPPKKGAGKRASRKK